eukprot:SAG11_NODE_1464_length_4862_cov_1.419064_3_plen_61_part_00
MCGKYEVRKHLRTAVATGVERDQARRRAWARVLSEVPPPGTEYHGRGAVSWIAADVAVGK